MIRWFRFNSEDENVEVDGLKVGDVRVEAG